MMEITVSNELLSVTRPSEKRNFKTPCNQKSLQSMKGFLSHTEGGGKRILSPHDVKVENMSNGENRSFPASGAPTCAECGRPTR